jgi:hypothetical protein
MEPEVYEFVNYFKVNVAFLRKIQDEVMSMKQRGATFNPRYCNRSSAINVAQAFPHFKETVAKTAPEYDSSGKMPTSDDVIRADNEAFENYDEVITYIPVWGKFKYIFAICALQAGRDMGMQHCKIKRTTIEESVERFQKNRSAGAPTNKKKGSDEAREHCYEFYYKFESKPTFTQLISLPTVVFHRFQTKYVNEAVTKIRQVWALPFAIQALEGVFFRDVLDSYPEYLASKKIPATTNGLTLVDISDRIIPHFRSFYSNIGSFDVKSFDQNIPFYFWAAYYACFFVFNPQLSCKEKKQLRLLMSYQCFTPYAYQGNLFRCQMRGIPSGSLMTNHAGSFFSRLIANFAFYRSSNGLYLANDNAICCGDDNLFTLSNISESQVKSAYEFFGLEVNISKSSIHEYDESIDFLGYKWDNCNRPYQELEWYLTHFIYPQSFIKDDAIPNFVLQTYRAISIAAPLYGGMRIFSKYIGRYDSVYQDLLDDIKNGRKAMIPYIGEDKRLEYVTIPLLNILQGGWRYYSKATDI